MARLSGLAVNDTGNLTLPSGTTGQRPSTSATIVQWTNTGTQAVNVLSGSATTTTTSWTCPAGVNQIEVLVVAGGGGGGGHASSDKGGAGGGAGGLIYNSTYRVVPSTSYTVTVGQSGVGGTAGNDGSQGGNSSFHVLTAIGGGYGARGAGGGPFAGGNGGSGGGGTADGNGANGAPGTGTLGQGFAGGTNGQANNSAGGGGAGGIGYGNTASTGGAGGPGLPFNISGTLTHYAGGGGGAAYSGTPGIGGIGGGGAGGATGTVGTAGTAGTGGGGGGAGSGASGTATAGGAGGAGTVIIRYYQDSLSEEPSALTRVNTTTNLLEVFKTNSWQNSKNNTDVITSGLVLYLDPSKYIAGSSTITDLGPNSFVGTLNNGVGYSTANGGVFTLDGSNDYIRIPVSSAFNVCQKGFTISLWAYPTGLGDYHWFNNHIQAATGTGAVSGAILRCSSDGTLFFQTRLDNTCCQTVQAAGAYVASKWIHLTGTYDGQYLRLYKNGQLISGSAATGAMNFINDLYLGVNSDTFALNGTYSQQAAGKLGPVLLYNRALTDDEVRRNYSVHISKFSDVSEPLITYQATYVKEGLLVNIDTDVKNYNFNNNTIYDSGSAAYCTLTNGATYNLADRSITFDGTNDYLSVPSSQFILGLNFSMEAWINFSSYSGKTRQYLIDLRGDGSDTSPYVYLLIDYSSSPTNIKITLATGSGTEIQTSELAVSLNTWHQFFATRDNGSSRLYLDGTLVLTSVQSNQGFTSYTMNQAFRVGTYAGAGAGAEYYLQGKLAGARVYNRTLTLQEIQQNYQALKYRYGQI